MNFGHGLLPMFITDAGQIYKRHRVRFRTTESMCGSAFGDTENVINTK